VVDAVFIGKAQAQMLFAVRSRHCTGGKHVKSKIGGVCLRVKRNEEGVFIRARTLDTGGAMYIFERKEHLSI
jgi:hypothetical protein